MPRTSQMRSAADRTTIPASHAHAGTTREAVSHRGRPRRADARSPRPRASRLRCRLAPPPRSPPARRPLRRGPTGDQLEGGRLDAPRPCRGRARRRRASRAAAPIAARASGRVARSCSAAASSPTSRSPTATLSATSSGSSANQPASLTTSGLPSDIARIAVPDVSPIVGERRLTWTSQAAISAQRRRSSTQPSRTIPSPSSPSRWRRRSRSNPGDDRADEQQSGVRELGADAGERLEELRHALARVDVPECADQRVARDSAAGANSGTGHAGMRDVEDVPFVAGALARGRRRSASGRRGPCASESTSPQREVLRAGLPERREPLVEHAVREQPADDAVLALHRVEVAVAVASPDGHVRDQVVDDEVVEDDERPAFAGARRGSSRALRGCCQYGKRRGRRRAAVAWRHASRRSTSTCSRSAGRRSAE